MPNKYDNKHDEKKHSRNKKDDPLVFDDSLSNVLIVDGLPVVPAAKYEKLQTYLGKFFKKADFSHAPFNDNISIPIKENGKETAGYAFVEYETPAQASTVCSQMNGYRFDASHSLKVNLGSEFDKMANVSEEYKPPVPKTITNKVNLRFWLNDEYLRDQFVVRHGSETEVWWNDPLRRANEKGRQICYAGDREKQEKKNWTKLYVMWSPQGSYLATFHKEGIMIWGGDDFTQIARFKHQGVKWIDFSPCETYLVTCNGQEKDPECVKIWDIRTAEKKRAFEKGFAPGWPIFKWSYDDKYFARIDKDKLMIFEVETMGLVDKKSLQVERIHEIQWSPKEYVLAYWVPEIESEPATVSLIEIPSKRKLRDVHVHTRSQLCPRRQKGEDGVEKCTATKPCRDCKITLHWQSQGEYLAAKMCRRKTKHKVSTTFQILRLGDNSEGKEEKKTDKREIPVEVLDVEDSVLYFAWEPNAKRFGIIHGEGQQKNNVRFYELKNQKLKLVAQLAEKACNCLFWSPRGNLVVLAGFGALNGALEWFDVTSKESCATVQHFMCTDVEWDPSGRYVITAVTQPLRQDSYYRYNSENGYRLWSMHGQSLATVRLESCYQVNWRPRPPRLLTAEQEKEIKKSVKAKYWDKFAKEDEEIETFQMDDFQKQKKRMELEWKRYREETRKHYEEEATLRAELVPEDKEGDFEDMEEVFEEELEVLEEII